MTLPILYAIPRPGIRFEGPAAAREIVNEVAAKHRITMADLLGHNRCKELAVPRQEAYARLRSEITIRNAPPSYPRIGRWMGGRDHSTIIHGIRRHEERMGVAA